MIRKRLFEGGIVLMALAVLQMLLVLVYWEVKSYDIIDIQNSPYPIVTPQVKPGDYLVYHTKYCVKKSVPGIVHQTFQDHSLTFLPTRTTKLPVGCIDADVSILVPKSVVPGKYTLNTISTYTVNPIRTVEYTSETQEFEVILN